MANAIPIAPASEDRELMKKAFAEIDRALARGQIYLFVTFPQKVCHVLLSF